ncbi:MAG TPA: glutaminyl-peptide cyclotransferase [Blastocatellia bacterium]|nr:glutaminyl-peptide cyclotransferase [Blastocatellia bacterium]
MSNISLNDNEGDKTSYVRRSGCHAANSIIVLIVLASILLAACSESTSRSNASASNRPTAPGSSSASQQSSNNSGGPKLVPYEVVNSYPHDPQAFLQGLVWYDGAFYESTGQFGQSTLRLVEFPTGRVLKKHDLAPELFGEGLAIVGDRLIQLTWQSHIGFVYDRATFNLIQTFSYDTEGWGLTYDGSRLILSDGSDQLTFIDPKTFKPTGKLSVTFNSQKVTNINELEFIEGEIWANIWHDDRIIRIDPATGRVNSYLNLKDLRPPETLDENEAVLNGIAYDAAQKRIFVSGKLWPRIFEIKLKQ